MSIHILSQQLSNQIAAGEVIERAASVVKELMENAIDSGASNVQVEILRSGKSLIRVTDNGAGIEKNELKLAVSRHATSKVNKLEDLNTIESLGFRGEALASISSVSRLSIQSFSQATPDAIGWGLDTGDDSEFANYQAEVFPAPIKLGTLVEVRDLFFNTPARRKFLRTDKTEFRHIEQTFKNIAISHPEIGFSLKHNQKLIKKLSSVNDHHGRLYRLEKLISADFVNHVRRVDYSSFYSEELKNVSLSGWIADADYLRMQADQQYFYINGRYIRDKLISHALRQVFQQAFSAEEYPAYVLYLEIDPEQLDVNVHPGKQEVRFHHTRMIHDFIVSALMQTLSPAMTIGLTEQDDNISNTGVESSENLRSGYDKVSETHSSQYQNSLAGYQHTVPSLENISVKNDSQPLLNFQSQFSEMNYHCDVLRVLDGKFIITTYEEGFYLIDSYQLMLLANQFSLSQTITQQDLLIPTNNQFNSLTVSKILAHEKQLNQLGVDFSCLGENSIILRKIPHLPFRVDAEKLLNNIAELFTIKKLVDQNNLTSGVACSFDMSLLKDKNTVIKILDMTFSRQQQHYQAAIRQLDKNAIQTLFQ